MKTYADLRINLDIYIGKTLSYYRRTTAETFTKFSLAFSKLWLQKNLETNFRITFWFIEAEPIPSKILSFFPNYELNISINLKISAQSDKIFAFYNKATIQNRNILAFYRTIVANQPVWFSVCFSFCFAGIRKNECVRRRRLGRNPRIPFSTEQVTILERKFRSSPYLSNSDVAHLSKCLQLSESRVSRPIFLDISNYSKIHTPRRASSRGRFWGHFKTAWVE